MHRVTLPWSGEPAILANPGFRYAILDRLARLARARDVDLLAFGIGTPAIRLVLDADADRVDAVVGALRSGTSRSSDGRRADLAWRPTGMCWADDAPASVLWAHAACEGDPLASPWTSHRDWLGFRQAAFFDASPRRGIDRARLVRAADTPPPSRTPTAPPRRAPMGELLRISAAVLGRLPADPRTFGLYAHTAAAVGYPPRRTAAALAVTPRRVYQLLHRPHPLVPVALAHLADARLATVP